MKRWIDSVNDCLGGGKVWMLDKKGEWRIIRMSGRDLLIGMLGDSLRNEPWTL